MPLAEQAQHFVRSPDWTWYILVYFFCAGLSGGSYVIANLFQLRGEPADEHAARVGHYAAFVALLPCPVMLILDLGSPLRFWHMLWNTTPGDTGPILKAWSPMSIGAWALLVYGAFATVAFVAALVRDGKLRWSLARWAVRLLDGGFGKVVLIVGSIFALFVAGYTGVLLSVSNQPIWSDSWALGGLFLASGMSGSAALVLFLLRFRPAARVSAGPLTVSERLYAGLELLLIVVFAVTLIGPGTFDDAFGFPWLLLWLVAFAGLVPGIAGLVTERLAITPEGVTVSVATQSVAVPALVLGGVLALRAAVIFSVH